MGSHDQMTANLRHYLWGTVKADAPGIDESSPSDPVSFFQSETAQGFAVVPSTDKTTHLL